MSGGMNLHKVAESIGTTKDELLALAKRAYIEIEYVEVLGAHLVSADGATRLVTAVERKRAGKPLLRTNDRVQWDGVFSSLVMRGTVQTSEWPGDLRSLVLWDGREKPGWEFRDLLKKIRKEA